MVKRARVARSVETLRLVRQMSVARISGPQLLDLALRTTQHTVDEKTVGIGGDLGCDPGRKPYE